MYFCLVVLDIPGRLYISGKEKNYDFKPPMTCGITQCARRHGKAIEVNSERNATVKAVGCQHLKLSRKDVPKYINLYSFGYCRCGWEGLASRLGSVKHPYTWSTRFLPILSTQGLKFDQRFLPLSREMNGWSVIYGSIIYFCLHSWHLTDLLAIYC